MSCMHPWNCKLWIISCLFCSTGQLYCNANVLSVSQCLSAAKCTFSERAACLLKSNSCTISWQLPEQRETEREREREGYGREQVRLCGETIGRWEKQVQINKYIYIYIYIYMWEKPQCETPIKAQAPHAWPLANQKPWRQDCTCRLKLMYCTTLCMVRSIVKTATLLHPACVCLCVCGPLLCNPIATRQACSTSRCRVARQR